MLSLFQRMEGKKKRQGYSREDEANMWMFIYRELREGNPSACEPKGLRIWDDYTTKCDVDRTVDSLNTHFRRHMADNLHKAELSCNVMMYLYRRLKLTMESDVKRALELKFTVEIELNSDHHVKTIKTVVRPPSNQENSEGDHSSQNPASSNERAQDEPYISSRTGSLTPPPKRRLNSSLNF
ncbi:hypothetical protein OSTOST_05668, partial [Ostertagia ostertagi]